MKKVLTVPMLDALKPIGKDYVIGDVEHKGLTIRVSAAGVKTWVFPHRSPKTGKGRQHEARAVPDAVAQGRSRRLDRSAEGARRGTRSASLFAFGKDDAAPVDEKLRTTYGALVAIYDQAVLVKQRTRRDRYRMLVRMGERLRLDRSHRERDHAERGMGGAQAHGRGARSGRGARDEVDPAHLFRWARQDHHGYVATNPFGDLEAPARKNQPRDRTLSIDELLAVWNALDDPMAYRDRAALCDRTAT